MIFQLKAILKSLVQNRIFQHLLFWACSYSVLLQLFALENELSEIDYVYTAFFHISLVLGVYFNIEVLVRFLLKRERYILYLLALTGTWFLTAATNQFTYTHISDWITSDYLFISSYSFEDLLKFSFVYLVLTTLLKLSKSWFYILETQKQMEALKRENVEAELNALKSNVNPHFLFNNLNSLYALARKKSDKTSEYILKLSELMRYMIYEAKDKFVPLEKEVNYITNYLELQKLRCHSGTNIHYSIEGEIGLQRIAPFLMIPFIENGFKHGGMNQLKHDIVDLQLKIDGESLCMILRNSVPVQNSTDIDGIGGFGIENVKNRLQSLYHNKHELLFFEKEDEFIVELKLKLNHE